MPILEDILKYEYAPLKQIVVIVMHRLYDDTEGEELHLYCKTKKADFFE
jgi:hypothetical protein